MKTVQGFVKLELVVGLAAKGREITNTDSVRMTKSKSGDWTISR